MCDNNATLLPLLVRDVKIFKSYFRKKKPKLYLFFIFFSEYLCNPESMYHPKCMQDTFTITKKFLKKALNNAISEAIYKKL